MKRILFFFLIFSSLLKAETDSEDENPALFHHVNVITGDLNLFLEDTVVHGAKELPMVRSYTSAGALERGKDDDDLLLKKIKNGFNIQGGWSYFPHAHLLVRPGRYKEGFTAYVADKTGSVTAFEFVERVQQHEILMRPKSSSSKAYGKISGKSNSDKRYLILNVDSGWGNLYLPDGSVLSYEGRDFRSRMKDGSSKTAYYQLRVEELPSKHKIHYNFDNKDRLKEVCYTNQKSDKTFSSVKFYLERTQTPYRFQAHTSDGKEIKYDFIEFEERDYLSSITNIKGMDQRCEYAPGRKGIGARMNALYMDEKLQFRAHYHLPGNKKDDSKWRDHPEKKPFAIDKVQRLEAPLGPDGEMITFASFSYQPDLTEVRDSQNLLIRYHHSEGHPTCIEYFDKCGQYASSIKFGWAQNRMISKAELDVKHQPLFSKTFAYDEAGNVTKEIFWGNVTGQATGPFKLEADGSLSNAESYTKTYEYSPALNLLVKEEEEEGLTYLYQYLPGTDLLTAKMTLSQEQSLLREFFFYNEDNLLIAEMVDDGSSPDPRDLSGVTERKIKRYELDPATGLQMAASDHYLDKQTGQEVQISRVQYTYSPQKLVTEEAVFDASGAHRYTIYTDYNEKGKIVRKTTPLGQDNLYTYDAFGNTVEAREVGKPIKKATYDTANRPILSEEIDLLGNSKISHSTFDVKGRLLATTDHKGNSTKQTYDAFGKCLRTEFAKVKDENGNPYQPVITFSYDNRGNLATTTNPRGETTETFYTTLRKPYRIIQADGAETFHVYNKNGTIAKTLHPDGTEEQFTYDAFQRVKQKIAVSAQGNCLKQETLLYNSFHLVKHVDERGLVTSYFYDGAGRLTEEEAAGRWKRYEYDALGFLERTYEGELCHVQVHDVGGRVTEDWTEDGKGTVENKMSFFYDEHNHKIKGTRLTSKGIATDHFAYDGEGRLSLHTDPLGEKSHFLYTESHQNDLGQCVLQKTTIDPIGLIKIETYDALSHLVSIEKKDAKKQTVSKEEYFYDRAGNKSKRISYVYAKSGSNTPHTIAWEHDACGRVLQEIESDKKATYYQYDTKGRLVQKVLPSEISLSYRYDGIDRIVEQSSSDGTIHYTYGYGQGPDPIYVEDLVQQNSLARKYNGFGDLTEERNPEGLLYKWEYDDRGRCVFFTLPDESTIAHTYSDLHMVSVRRTTVDGQIYEHGYDSFDPNGHVQKETLIRNLGTVSLEHDLLERPYKQHSSWHECTLSYGPSSLVKLATNSLFEDKTYTYDALNQLRTEGDKSYYFDSLGNRAGYKTSECNELLSTPKYTFIYDEDGNPISKESSAGKVQYRYDALGRLTTIVSIKGDEVSFAYDAFSRLVSKTTSKAKKFYLYDQDVEIGAVTPSGKVIELKILGLGIKGDIGAAVALELEGEVYIPLHDFNGSIISLVGLDGSMPAFYKMDAFGKEIFWGNERIHNPWRFCSKRHEEGLIFFGLRFYDPSVERWLTPDPAGYAEGPNLYVYVLNSPMNRLDLFGLFSDPSILSPRAICEIPLPMLRHVSTFRDVNAYKGSLGGATVDWVITGGNFHKLQFTPEELNAGKVNIFDHMHELMPSKGSVVGLVSLQNGINTTLDEFVEMGDLVKKMLPTGTLIIGLHNPPAGILRDITRASTEVCNFKETPMVAKTRQFFSAVTTGLCKINPDLLWLHVAHSEGGGIAVRAVEGMTQEQKQSLKNNMYYLGVGPMLSMPRDYAVEAKNYYCTLDCVTGLSGRISQMRNLGKDSPSFDITFLSAKSRWHEKLLGVLGGVQHRFAGATYQSGTKEWIDYLGDTKGYHGLTR